MRLTDPTEGLKGSSLEEVALTGDSLQALRDFWERSAEVDAVKAIADEATDDDFETADGARETRHLVELVPDNGKVLDLGCGIGRVMLPLAHALEARNKTAELHGVDISARMVEQGRERLRHLDNVHFHHGNGYDLGGFDDATFDAVYSVFVLQHVPKSIAGNYLKEAHRVLKPQGVFWLQVPNILRDDHLMAFNHFTQPHFVEHPYPMHFYGPFELVRLLQLAGFHVERLEDILRVTARKTGQVGVSDDVARTLGPMAYGLCEIPFPWR